MKNYFEILFLEEAFDFLTGLERKHYEKILYLPDPHASPRGKWVEQD